MQRNGLAPTHPIPAGKEEREEEEKCRKKQGGGAEKGRKHAKKKKKIINIAQGTEGNASQMALDVSYSYGEFVYFHIF